MSKVYRYGLLPATENGSVVDEQMYRAHRYYNKLIEIYRTRKKAVDEVKLGLGLTDEEKKAFAALSDEEKAAQKAQRAAQHEELKRLAKPHDDACAEAIRAARAECGVFWGTYLLVEAAAKQAASTSKGDPRFRTWDGSSYIGVQVQKQVQPSSLFRIEDAPDTRKGRRAGQRKLLHIVVASENRTRTWATFPLVLHRPLTGRVTWVRIVRRRVAGRDQYHVCFTVDAATSPSAVTSIDVRREEDILAGLRSTTPRTERQRVHLEHEVRMHETRLARAEQVVGDRGLVAIDVGWRAMGSGGLRVAAWLGQDGQSDMLELPESYRQRILKAESIRSVRDEALNTLRAEMQADTAVTWPETWVERRKYLHLWKSPSRFYGLRNAFRKAEMAVPTTLETWYHRDKHLWQYEHGLRAGALGHRSEIYRRLAAELAERYTDCAIEDISMHEFAAYAEGETRWDKAAPGQRFEAGISSFFAALRNAFASRGGHVFTVPRKNSTQMCARCQHINADTPTLMITCAGCGVTYDRDVNARENLLARGLANREQARALATEKARDSVLQKQKRLARMQEGRRAKTAARKSQAVTNDAS